MVKYNSLLVAVMLVLVACAQTSPDDEMEGLGTLNFSVCTKDIEHPQTRNSCIITKFAQDSRDIEVCDQMYEQDYNRDYDNVLYEKYTCYVRVASLTRDENICNKITLEDKKSECFDSVRKWKQGPSSCEEHESDNSRYYCYAEFGIADRDLSVCEMIPTPIIDGYESPPDSKTRCYRQIAAKTHDISICENLPFEDPNGHRKDLCYLQVARENKDASICPKISTEIYRESCFAET